MSVCRILLVAVAALPVCQSAVEAQQQSGSQDSNGQQRLRAGEIRTDPQAVVSLFGDHDSTAVSPNQAAAPMSPAALRQARALRASEQRWARIEHNRWIGHEPLRPNWNTIPTMRSRFERPVIYIPVYLHR